MIECNYGLHVKDDKDTGELSVYPLSSQSHLGKKNYSVLILVHTYAKKSAFKTSLTTLQNYSLLLIYNKIFSNTDL